MSAAEEGDSERSRWALSRMEGRPRGDGMEGRLIVKGRLAMVVNGMTAAILGGADCWIGRLGRTESGLVAREAATRCPREQGNQAEDRPHLQVVVVGARAAAGGTREGVTTRWCELRRQAKLKREDFTEKETILR